MHFRTIRPVLLIEWDGATWTDESDRLKSARGTHQQTSPEGGPLGVGHGQPATVVIDLINHDGRFSPDNPDSPISASIQDGKFRHKKVRVGVAINDAASQTLFTGFIDELDQAAITGVATIRAHDWAARLSDMRIATCLYEDYSTGSYIESVLLDAGLSPSDLDLDHGIVRLPYAWLAHEPVWSELCLAAEAEGGRLYTNPEGQVVFDSAQTIVLGSGSIGQLTVENFSEIHVSYDFDNHATVVIVEYFPKHVGHRAVVWEMDERPIIPSGASRLFRCELDTPVKGLEEPAYKFRAMGLDLTNDLVVSASQTGASHVVIGASNQSAFSGRLVELRLIGYPVIGAAAQFVSACTTAGIEQWGKIAHDVTQNPYIQSWDQAYLLATLLVDRMEKPRRVYRATGLPGSPNVTLGGRMEIVETTTGTCRMSFITGVSWQLSQGYSMDLTLVETSIYPVDEYFVIGQSQWDGCPMFY